MGCKMTHCAADLDLPSSQFSLQLEHLRMREAAGCVFQCGNDLHVQPIRTSFSTRKKMTMLEKCTQFSGEKKTGQLLEVIILSQPAPLSIAIHHLIAKLFIFEERSLDIRGKFWSHGICETFVTVVRPLRVLRSPPQVSARFGRVQ